MWGKDLVRRACPRRDTMDSILPRRAAVRMALIKPGLTKRPEAHVR